jgi:AGZA family xanthine/uracil permease-like MFS transporter
LFTYTVINGAVWAIARLSRDAIVPENYDMKEYWTWRHPGERPWIVRALFRVIYWSKWRKERNMSLSLASGEENTSADMYRSDMTSKGAEDGKHPARPETPQPLRQML